MKFNCKRQPPCIILPIDLAAAVGIAIERQDVLAWKQHPGSYRKMRLLVGVPARNLCPKEHAAIWGLDLGDVIVEAPSRYKVKIQEEGFIRANRESPSLFARCVDAS